MTPPNQPLSQPPPNHDRGLEYALATLHRRRFLGLFTAAGLAVAGCTTDSGTAGQTPSMTGMPSSTATTSPATSPATSPTTTPTTTPGTTPGGPATAVDEIPAETGGPFPGDGSNGPNVLTESGIVRSDITTSFGSASGVATGVPLSVELLIVDADEDQPLAGAAVYVWHCDAQGRYSLYSDGVTNENYLRGVQATDSSGKVTFTTIFPAAYPGRWPHIHFEVYSGLDEATAAGRVTRTSQLALSKDVCAAVYATDGYDGSAQNLDRTPFEDDNVFGEDDGVHQLATVTGDVTSGYVATLTVGV